jgi:hypothetical protein
MTVEVEWDDREDEKSMEDMAEVSTRKGAFDVGERCCFFCGVAVKLRWPLMRLGLGTLVFPWLSLSEASLCPLPPSIYGVPR